MKDKTRKKTYRFRIVAVVESRGVPRAVAKHILSRELETVAGLVRIKVE